MTSATTTHLDTIRAALGSLIEDLTAAQRAPEETDLTVALRRVPIAAQARAMVAEVAEQLLDDALVTARQAHPAGATWAQLGEQLGLTGQGVSKRLRQHGRTTARTRPTPMPSRPRDAVPFNAAQYTEQLLAQRRASALQDADTDVSAGDPVAAARASMLRTRAELGLPAPGPRDEPHVGQDAAKPLDGAASPPRRERRKRPRKKPRRRH
jgi:hypothetical protein